MSRFIEVLARALLYGNEIGGDQHRRRHVITCLARDNEARACGGWLDIGPAQWTEFEVRDSISIQT
jgi:hypothetical protein